MSVLLQIRGQLDKAMHRVAELEKALAEHPGYPSIAANLDSAVRIQKKLEAQFEEAAASIGVEVCRYRAFDDTNRASAGAAFDAVSGFQRLVSVVFGSKKYGKKQKASVTSELEKETALGFGYAFVGSIGLVLTIRRDTDLFGESFLDDTINTIFAMAKAKDSAAIQHYADTLGAGAINALYSWAHANTDHGLGAEIEWKRGAEVRGKLLVQRQELSKLETAIEKTGSEEVESVTYEGVLTMADAGSRRFKLKPDGMREIRGTFELGAIDETREASVPRRYRADLTITTTMQYSTSEEKKRYHLLRLAAVKSEKNGDEPKPADIPSRES
jgi:hypothetical protein